MEIRRLEPGMESNASDVIRLFYRIDLLPEVLMVTLADLRSFLECDTNHLIAAFDQNDVVGGLLAYELDRLKDPWKMLFVWEVGVAESHRQRGVARQMLERAKQISRERNIRKIMILTHADNEPAMHLYESAGGQPDPQVIFFIPVNQD